MESLLGSLPTWCPVGSLSPAVAVLRLNDPERPDPKSLVSSLLWPRPGCWARAAGSSPSQLCCVEPRPFLFTRGLRASLLGLS